MYTLSSKRGIVTHLKGVVMKIFLHNTPDAHFWLTTLAPVGRGLCRNDDPGPARSLDSPAHGDLGD